MLLGVCATHRPFRVQMVWQRDVDGLHIGIIQDTSIALITSWNAKLLPKCVGRGLRSACHGHQLPVARVAYGIGQLARNASRAQNSPPYLIHSVSSFPKYRV